MNSPAVKPIAPSTHPALELIALAQLSPEEAGRRLRALLLANPRYFGNIPPASFNAVLKIQEDTAYECLSSVIYDSGSNQLRAILDVKQTVGYSGAARVNGSEEFVRFYVSGNGGAEWLDQGMRSVIVSDGLMPGSLAYEVILQIDPAWKSGVPNPQRKVRAILSWNSPPPAGAPGWTPVSGNVVESDVQIGDSHMSFSAGLRSPVKVGMPDSTVQAEMHQDHLRVDCADKQKDLITHAEPSTQTDPQHRFLTHLFARAARHTLLGIPNPACRAIDPSPRACAAAPLQIPDVTESRFAAVV